MPFFKNCTISYHFLDISHMFNVISVSSKLDLANIQYVYIVKNFFKKEQEDLEQAVMEEDQ